MARRVLVYLIAFIAASGAGYALGAADIVANTTTGAMRSSIAYTGLFRNSEAGKAIDLSQHRGVAESLQSLTPAEKRLLMVMVFILVMLLMALIYLYFVALF